MSDQFVGRSSSAISEQARKGGADRLVDLQCGEARSVSSAEWNGDSGVSSVRASTTTSSSVGGVVLRDPLELIQSLLGCGMSADVAGACATSYFNALCVLDSASPPASAEGSLKSGVSKKALRTRKWESQMSVMPYQPGQCYLHPVRWGRRNAYLAALKQTPTFMSFVQMLEPNDLNVQVAKEMGMYRIDAGASSLSAPVYHVASECDAGVYIGSVYDCVACVLRMYPLINQRYKCDTYGVEVMPLTGVIGALPQSVVTVVRGSTGSCGFNGVRHSDLSTPGGYNTSDLSISDYTGTDSQLSTSSSSASARGTLRVTHQELSYNVLDRTLQGHLRSAAEACVVVVPPVLAPSTSLQRDSHQVLPLQAELSLLKVSAAVTVAVCGYTFDLDSHVLLVLSRGAELEIFRGRSVEVVLLAVKSHVSVWWQRFYRPVDLKGRLLLPAGFNGILSIHASEYGWYDCEEALKSGEYVDVVPLLITEVPGRDFSVQGLKVQSSVSGKVGLLVRSGRLVIGPVSLRAGHTYYALGMQGRADLRVWAVDGPAQVNLYGPVCNGSNLSVNYTLVGVR